MSEIDSALAAQNQATFKEANPILDKLSHAWQRIESALIDQGVLKECHVSYKELSKDDDSTTWSYLGIVKIHGAWKICHGIEQSFEGEILWRPITESSISIRIKMLEYIGLLQKELTKCNEGFMEDLHAAADLANRIANDLEINNL